MFIFYCLSSYSCVCKLRVVVFVEANPLVTVSLVLQLLSATLCDDLSVLSKTAVDFRFALLKDESSVERKLVCSSKQYFDHLLLTQTSSECPGMFR